MREKIEIIALWTIQFYALALAVISVGAFIGGWFFWGWNIVANVFMTFVDILAAGLSLIITYVIWSR